MYERATMALRSSLLIVFFLPGLALAGEWVPDPSRSFSLAVQTDKSHELTAADREWARSLVRNLEKKGGIVKKHSIFVRTASRLEINGRQVEAEVFRDTDRPDLFLLVHDRTWFLIDYGKEALWVVGEGGSVSLHFPDSRSFVVAVNGFGGIPVRGTEGNPSFTSAGISWH